MPTLNVSFAHAGQRLDRFLAAEVPHLSRTRIQALIKSGHVRLNDRAAKAGEILKTGALVSWEEPPSQTVQTVAEDIPLCILHEDADLLVLDKPAGMVVHPAAGNWQGTLVNALLHHCGTLSAIGGEQRPGIVHRLDKDTTGCVVVAKNDLTHQTLARQFAGREIRKIYLALVEGRLKTKSGMIDAPIGRHPVHRKKMAVLPSGKGRPAQTEYRVLQETPLFTVVECRLLTGRTHQIRVHLKHIGHPLVGDPVYGHEHGFPRQMLHAWKLGFAHPRTGQWLELVAPLPRDFLEAGVTLA